MARLGLDGEWKIEQRPQILGMSTYRKKPTEHEVMRFEYNEQALFCLGMWMRKSLGTVSKARHPGAKAEAEIKTLEDGVHLKVKHIATEGDYIVRGVDGEFWAVKPHIFEQTYEKV